MKKNHLLVIILTFFFIQLSFSQKYKDKSIPVDQRVEDLLKRMTIEEKASQLRIVHALQTGIKLSKDTLSLAPKAIEELKMGIGGIKNPGELISPEKSALLNNQLQKYIIKKSRLGIPAMFVGEAYNGIDAHGSTKFLRPIAQSATWNVALIKDVWDVIGREARLRGFHMIHSPVADIARDPRFGRMSESFGEDSHLTTEMVVSAITGVQGDSKGLTSTHIGAVVKHFVGYAQVMGGKNFSAIEVSPRVLNDELLPPFEAAIKRANALGLMPSHGDINGIATHGNPELLTNLLRNKWGFKGYVVSDSNDIARLFTLMKVADSPEKAVIMGLIAGIDIDLYSPDCYILIPKIVKTNPEILPLVDRAVRRVLRTKFVLGLFDNPYIDIANTQKSVRTDKALNLSLASSLESIILLKNENDILPIKTDKYKRIALLGPLYEKSTIEDFKKVFGSNVEFVCEKGFNLTNEQKGTPQLTSKEDNLKAIDKMAEMASSADLTILFVGGDEYTAKEAFFANTLGDRDNIDLVGEQVALFQKLKSLGKPVVVALKHRRTNSIVEIAENADAILDCWELGESGDMALAKILKGDVSPSGKLPVTVPRTIGQLPFHYNQKEINNTKDYLFSSAKPLFPFGFGLSYSKFNYSNIAISKTKMLPNQTITVSVDLSNTGSFVAKEAVQLYVKDEYSTVMQPDRALKSFQKVELKPGETKTITFKITPEMLMHSGVDMKKVIEPGFFSLFIGGSSTADLSTRFEYATK